MMRRVTALLALFLSACSGGGDPGPVTPPVTPTIALSLASSAGTVARGSAATTTVSLTRGGGYTGTVTLAATGAPAGVQVTFDPSSLGSTATSAVATISVGATAAPGTATITIAASGSGVSGASATYTLTIPTPGIGVSAAATTLNVTQGTAGNVGITVSRSNGFADAITLAASGAPNGVTATFAPATVAAGATTSTLAFAVPANATPGSYPVTITASGTGVANASTLVTLTITAAATPAFGLSAAPAALTVTAGQSATSTVTAARSGGFAGDVAVTVTGAPAGMTATLAPTTIAANGTTSTLTVTTTGAVVPGNYTLTVNGTGTAVSAQSTTVAVTVNAAPGITVQGPATTVALTAGTSTSTPVTITRLGGFTGDVALAISGLPAGVTAAFAPATLTGVTLASTLTLTAAVNATVGNATLTITASGTGISAQTATFGLAIATAEDFSLSATAVSLAQGGTGTSTVTITRTGGFTGTVNLSLGSLPAGVTAVISPAAVTGTSATITFTATAGATTGAFATTLTGTSGALSRSTPVAGTVTATSGGSGNVTWTFCDTEDFPLWFAVQNGTNGAWTPVSATGTTTRSYNFTVNTVGGVAYAQNISSGGVGLVISYLTQAEMALQGTQECVTNPAKKSLTGTVAGLSAGQTATISVGNGSGTASTNGPVSITSAAAGTTDLFGYRAAFNITTFSFAPDRFILRRNVNFASVITPTLDFAGGDSFAPATAAYTVANTNGQPVTATTSFLTANGTAGSVASAIFSSSNPVTIYGVPAGQTTTGDLHQVLVFASLVTAGDTATRGVTQYNRELAARTVTLGAALTAPTVSSLGTAPYPRFTATGPWQSDYADGVGVGYSQSVTNGNSWTLSLSRGYSGAGASSWTLVVPDFSGVAGFNTSWGLSASSVRVSATASGIVNGLSGNGSWSEGGLFRFASRTSSITP